MPSPYIKHNHKGDLILPLWRNGWREKRSSKFRKCSMTGETIWPFQKAFAQDTFWGLSNAETHEETETEWITSATYTYLKLADKIVTP